MGTIADRPAPPNPVTETDGRTAGGAVIIAAAGSVQAPGVRRKGSGVPVAAPFDRPAPPVCDADATPGPAGGAVDPISDRPAPPQHRASAEALSAGGAVGSLDCPAPPEGKADAVLFPAGGAVVPDHLASSDHQPVAEVGAAGGVTLLDCPAPPDGPTKAGQLTAGGAVDLSPDHPAPPKAASKARAGTAGRAVKILDHPAPSAAGPEAILLAAGGVVEHVDARTYRHRAGSAFLLDRPAMPDLELVRAKTASGRDLRTIDELLGVFDAKAWRHLKIAARIFDETQNHRKRVASQLRQQADFPGREAMMKIIGGSEAEAKNALLEAMKRTVGPNMTAFIKGTPGVSWYSLARLVGEAGHPVIALPKHWVATPKGKQKRKLVDDPAFIRGPRQWRQRCGLGDPERRYRQGMTAEALAACGNPGAKTAAWNVVTTGYKACTGEVNKAGALRPDWIYRPVYLASRERTLGLHGEEWRPARHHAVAIRAMAKQLVDDLYGVAWMDLDHALGLG